MKWNVQRLAHGWGTALIPAHQLCNMASLQGSSAGIASFLLPLTARFPLQGNELLIHFRRDAVRSPQLPSPLPLQLLCPPASGCQLPTAEAGRHHSCAVRCFCPSPGGWLFGSWHALRMVEAGQVLALGPCLTSLSADF